MRGSNVDYIILNTIHTLPNMNKITLNLQSGYNYNDPSCDNIYTSQVHTKFQLEARRRTRCFIALFLINHCNYVTF
jgi:hypothetical protein